MNFNGLNFINWNYRFMPCFKGEILDLPDEQCIPIQSFQSPNGYEKAIRDKLIAYFEDCLPLEAASLAVKNLYTNEYLGLANYTDGEVIFSRQLFSYIRYNDFMLPIRWFNIIQEKNFILPNMTIDYDKMLDDSNYYPENLPTFEDELYLLKYVNFK